MTNEEPKETQKRTPEDVRDFLVYVLGYASGKLREETGKDRTDASKKLEQSLWEVATDLANGRLRIVEGP